jgi:hypothetical protein
MRFFTTIFLIVAFFSCSAQERKSSFDEFSKKFPEISFPFQINDSIAFNFWDTDNHISFDDIRGYDLVAKYASNDDTIEIHEFQCSRVGKYKIEDYIVLLYKTYTTTAGRGNPLIIITTFTETGEKRGEEIALWDDVTDPLYSQEVTLFIQNNNTFVIESIGSEYGLLNDEIVPKLVKERIFNYVIKKNGVIEKLDETVRVLFEDTNPEILDDFPK